jgi:hypothetical protein
MPATKRRQFVQLAVAGVESPVKRRPRRYRPSRFSKAVENQGT